MSSRHKWALDLNADAPRRADLKPPGDVQFVLVRGHNRFYVGGTENRYPLLLNCLQCPYQLALTQDQSILHLKTNYRR